MEKMQTGSVPNTFDWKRYLLPSAIILIIVIAASFIYYSYNAAHTAKAVLPSTVISQSVLEEQYGVRVNLLALTAAGGMVDLRLKVIDGEKAGALLKDKKNFPSLFVNGKNFFLNASEDAKSKGIILENNADVFLLFANAGNSVKRGTAISIVFGDIALEPIETK